METIKTNAEAAQMNGLDAAASDILTPDAAVSTGKALLAPNPDNNLSGAIDRNTPWTVVQTNPNAKNGFVVKMQRTLVLQSKLFGAKESKETSYISVPENVPVGTKIQVAELREFQLQEHPMLNPATGEEFIGYWWHIRKSYIK
jgi:hypothetical protein